MIDAWDLADVDQNRARVEEFALFCAAVANKPADQTARKLGAFLCLRGNLSPCEYVLRLGEQGGQLWYRLMACRFGQYMRIQSAFTDLSRLHVQCNRVDLLTCTLDDLLACRGVGHKTARYFLLYTRPEARYAVLDTHVLRWMREHLGVTEAQGNLSAVKYARLERLVLAYCEVSGVEPRELDTLVWKRGAALIPQRRGKDVA